MPVVFAQPEAYNPGVSYGYGALTQEMADRDFALRARAHMGGGGGGGTQVQMYNPGGGNVQGMGGGGHGGGTDYESLVNSTLAIRQGELSQAESIRLQRDKNSLSQLDEAFNDGQLDRETYQNARVKLMTGIDPLQQRQVQAHVAAMEQQTQHQRLLNANMQAQQTLNARNLQDRTSYRNDPRIEAEVTNELRDWLNVPGLTEEDRKGMIDDEVAARDGQTEFFEHAPGHFTEVTHGRQNRAERASATITADNTADNRFSEHLRHVRELVYGSGTKPGTDSVLQTRDLPDTNKPGKTIKRQETREEAVDRIMREDMGHSSLSSLRTEREQLRMQPFSPNTTRRLNPHQAAEMGRLNQLAQRARTANLGFSRFQGEHVRSITADINRAKTLFAGAGSLANLERNSEAWRQYQEIAERLRSQLAPAPVAPNLPPRSTTELSGDTTGFGG